MATSLREKIILNLDEAQSGMHHHQKLLKSLKALYGKHDSKEFFEAFYPPFSNVLLAHKNEPAADRLVDFVAKFAASVTPTETEEGRT